MSLLPHIRKAWASSMPLDKLRYYITTAAATLSIGAFVEELSFAAKHVAKIDFVIFAKLCFSHQTIFSQAQFRVIIYKSEKGVGRTSFLLSQYERSDLYEVHVHLQEDFSE